MLVQFTVSNFQSFQEPSTLSMQAAKRRSKNKTLDKESIFETTGPAEHGGALQLLKVAALYGANGSGKSNLIAAMRFMKQLVLNSSKESQIGDAIPLEPFRFCDENLDEPSTFEITFVQKRIIYQYSFSADRKSVRSEKLTRRGPRNKRDSVLFTRENNDIRTTKAFPEGEGLSSKTRPNSLFVSVCANFSGTISTEVIDWFRKLKIIKSQDDAGYRQYTLNRLKEEKWNADITEFISGFDLGIERLTATDSPRKNPEPSRFPIQRTDLSSFHNKYDREGNLTGEVSLDFARHESQGTQKLISLSAPLLDTLSNSYTLVIDEFDSRLHPIISRKLLEMFNSNFNSKNAQLIVATHDSNLLDKDLLRRDQIWFVEKDFFGGSHLHSLVEYKIRNDASYEKDYISGKYGAIPILGNIRRILVDEKLDDESDTSENSDEGEIA